MPSINALKVKLFADGADLDSMLALYKDPNIKGFTTNPTLMNRVGIKDYESFAKQVLAAIPDRPVSFEVFADDLAIMLLQAKIIASWGPNVNVKIPITNTKGEFTGPIIKELSEADIQLNITAIMTLEQVKMVTEYLSPETPAIISVFAGRIADTGIDPMPIMRECVEILKDVPMAELLWASPRELLNIIQADEVGCHIITATPELLAKLNSIKKDLTKFSLETVQMFYNDAQAAGYKINIV
jgi:transaldolase